jgi:hypothetical protein
MAACNFCGEAGPVTVLDGWAAEPAKVVCVACYLGDACHHVCDCRVCQQPLAFIKLQTQRPVTLTCPMCCCRTVVEGEPSFGGNVHTCA